MVMTGINAKNKITNSEGKIQKYILCSSEMGKTTVAYTPKTDLEDVRN